MPFENSDSLAGVPGIGPARLKALNDAGIMGMEDLLYRFPISFLDYDHPTAIKDIRPGEACAFAGEVLRARRSYGGVARVTARVADGTGEIECVWFRQPYIYAQLPVGGRLVFYGTAQMARGALTIVNPLITQPGERSGLVPVYPAASGVPGKLYRQMVQSALALHLDNSHDALPEDFRREHNLMPLREALQSAHFPGDWQSLKQARYRLSFEELLLTQLALSGERASPRPGVPMNIAKAALAPVLSRFPYRLTAAQDRVLDEILNDLSCNRAMARLVQGDVGSGKTALAYLALYAASLCGYQAAMMAPTEILARQHYQGAVELLSPLGIQIELLVGSLTAARRREARQRLSTGEAHIAFGTHALLSEGVSFRNLGLAITDEQHRFGVRQRSRLGELGIGEGLFPHVLVMSATPIPRSLALILYGDLDISAVDEMPPGRTPIRTHVVPEGKRRDMLEFLRGQMQKGGQVYVVCPLVETSDTLDELSAIDTHKELCEVFSEFPIGLVHGRQSAKEKEQQLSAFSGGDTRLLVSTTVIEVGVNVPNACVMVIEGADRFGLAQLHQLRGRVGRGERESFCFLMGEGEKLRALAATNDGFVIAQKDLEMRGPGELLGTRQSGAADSRLLALAGDASLLAGTSSAARRILDDPDDPLSKALLAAAHDRFGQRLAALARN